MLVVSLIIVAAALVLSVFFSFVFYSGAHLPNWVIAASKGKGYLAWRHQQTNALHYFEFDRGDPGFTFGLPSFKTNNEYSEIHLPLWIPFALVALSASLILYRKLNRPRPGSCGCCGYDLTGNISGRCPECGKVVPKETRRPRRAGPASRMRGFTHYACRFVTVMALWILAGGIRSDYQLLVLPHAVDPQGKYTPVLCRLSVANGRLIAKLNRAYDELRFESDWSEWKTFRFETCAIDLGLVMPRVVIHQTDAGGRLTVADIVLPFWPLVIILLIPRLVSEDSVLRRTPRRLRSTTPQSAAL